PESTSQATRCARVAVLPVPAPAMTSSGGASTPPPGSRWPKVAARRWAGLSRSSQPWSWPVAAGASTMGSASVAGMPASLADTTVCPNRTRGGQPSAHQHAQGHADEHRRAEPGVVVEGLEAAFAAALADEDVVVGRDRRRACEPHAEPGPQPLDDADPAD